MDVRLPDGTVVKGVPDGISKAELTNRLVANGYGAALSSAQDRAIADPTKGMSEVDKFRAGWGKRVADWGRGIEQLAAPSAGLQQEIDESRKLDAPLMNTASGMAGNIAGTMITAAPALAIPGVNTLAGASLLGAGQGVIEPVAAGESRAVNTGVAAAGGFLGQAAGNKLAQMASSRATQAATQQTQNAMRDATLKAGQEAGYVVPPSATGGSFIGNRLESIAGKAALGQEAAGRNQEVTNALARKALGLPDNQPISMAALEGVRKAEGRAYSNVAALSKDAADALENLKQSRADATAFFKHYDRSADPAALQKAQRAAADASLWERFLENEAMVSGKQELVPALREARAKIAKTYDVERALNTSTGDVSAPTLGRAVDRGRPLTGDLETIGRFADAFPRFATEGARVQTPGVSKIEAGLAALLGTTTGNPLLAALPLASGPMRSALLSAPAQRMLATPNYGPGMLNPIMGNPATAPALALGGGQLGILAAPSFLTTGR